MGSCAAWFVLIGVVRQGHDDEEQQRKKALSPVAPSFWAAADDERSFTAGFAIGSRRQLKARCCVEDASSVVFYQLMMVGDRCVASVVDASSNDAIRFVCVCVCKLGIESLFLGLTTVVRKYADGGACNHLLCGGWRRE